MNSILKMKFSYRITFRQYESILPECKKLIEYFKYDVNYNYASIFSPFLTTLLRINVRTIHNAAAAIA